MIDYHVHTMLCNHAEGSMAAYIKAAVALGLKEICFLDHLTLSESERPLSMTPDEVPLYFYAVRHLKYQYKGIIKIKVGLEIDFNPACVSRIEEIVRTFSFDVIGGSVHFLGDLNIASRRNVKKLQQLGIDTLWNDYLEKLEKMLDFSYFDMICHLDVAKKFGLKPPVSFGHKFDAILAKIRSKNLVVELNTSGYNYPVKEAYPSISLLKKCHKLGIAVTLGSDAHKPQNVGQHYAKVLSLLFSTGYRHLSSFINRKRYEIPFNNPMH